MHILMTGGTGLIGTATRELSAGARSSRDGIDAAVLRTERAAPRLYQKVVCTVQADVDAVINLAGAGLADRRWSCTV